MIIGIDLDGVVFDTENYFRTYAMLYDMAFLKNGLKKPYAVNLSERYGWTEEQLNKFYDIYVPIVLKKAPLKPLALEILTKLKQQGHTLICITMRGYFRQCEIDITNERFAIEGLKFDKIYFAQKNKLIPAKDESIDLMIDDNENIISQLSNSGIKCLHFKDADLQQISHSNVIAVQNWGEVWYHINNIVNNS